jgi:hypothetical protein
MERLLKRYDTGLEEVDSLEDLVLRDQESKPTAPESGSTKIYSKGNGIFRQDYSGLEKPVGGPELLRKKAGVARLCPAFWVNAGVPLANENRIWAHIWPTPQYLYVIGGCLDDWTVTDTVLRASWDNLTSWEEIGTLPAACSSGAILQDIAGDLYIFGGYDSEWNMLHTIMRTVQGDFGRWEVVSGAISPIVVTEAIAVEGKRYMVAGYDENMIRSEVWVADEHDLTSWQVVSYLPSELYGQSLLVIDNVLYAIGGHSANGALKSIYSAPLNNITNWTTHADCLFKEIYNSNLLVLGEKLILMGGYDSSENTCDTIQSVSLNNITGSWQAESDITDYAYGRVHFVIDRATRKLWRIGGEIISSDINMLYTDINISFEPIAESINIPVVQQIPAMTIYQDEETTLTGALCLKAYGGVFFGEEDSAPGAGGRKGILQRRTDGAVVLVDDSERIEGKIITEDDMEAAAFYRWGALK